MCVLVSPFVKSRLALEIVSLSTYVLPATNLQWYQLHNILNDFLHLMYFNLSLQNVIIADCSLTKNVREIPI